MTRRVDVVGVGAAEVDGDGAAVAGERHLAGLALRGLERRPVGDAVAVPGDDPGALARVGGGQLLAHQGVEQRRLARLDLAGDGDPQRLVEPVEHGLQAVDRVGRGRVRPRRVLEQAADLSSSVVEVDEVTAPLPCWSRRLQVGGEGVGLVAQDADALELGVDVAQALLAGGGVGLDRLLGGGQRLGGRAVQLLGPGGEVVAHPALDAAQRVAGVLPDHEADLVGVLAVRLAGLAAAHRELPLLLALQRRPAHEQADDDRRRVGHGQAGHAAEHAEHEQAAVAAAEGGQALGADAHLAHVDVGVGVDGGRAPRSGWRRRGRRRCRRRPRRSARRPGRSALAPGRAGTCSCATTSSATRR